MVWLISGAGKRDAVRRGRRCLTWQDFLDARGYIIIVPAMSTQHVELGVPLSWTVTSPDYGNLPPGMLVPVAETTYADFLEQAALYIDPYNIWCGEKDRYFRCVAE